MNIAELLRKMADIVDGHEGGQEQHQDEEPGEEHVDVNVKPMVPPLQQKLDLLKKLAGVETEENGEECGCEDDIQAQDDGVEEPEDELATIKRNAGLSMMSQMPTILAHIADEDEPFEG